MRKPYSRPVSVLSLLLFLLVCSGASARKLDATLDLIIRPISTLPTIVKAGESFEVTVSGSAPVEEMRVALYQGPTTIPVFALSRDKPPLQPKEGLLTIAATVPKDTPAGLYGLSVRLNPGRRSDTAERAVKVVADWPQSYSFAHVTDVHIGRQDPPLRDEVFKRTALEINRLGVDFVLITGDITDNATPEQYRRFLQILDCFDAPTFVTPGNHDRGEGEQFGAPNSIYERYCGPANYAFDFGSHRYLSLDTRWAYEFLVFPAQRAWLEAQLQRPKPSMGVVFSHRISEEEYPYFQEQLPAHNYALFVYGHTHDDGIAWMGPKRLMLLNTSHEFMGTYNVVRVVGDQVAAIDHYHRTCAD